MVFSKDSGLTAGHLLTKDRHQAKQFCFLDAGYLVVVESKDPISRLYLLLSVLLLPRDQTFIFYSIYKVANLL